MIWIELSILLGCIIIGARIGGLGLGVMGGVGLAVFAFVFGLQSLPDRPLYRCDADDPGGDHRRRRPAGCGGNGLFGLSR